MNIDSSQTANEEWTPISLANKAPVEISGYQGHGFARHELHSAGCDCLPTDHLERWIDIPKT